jgi:peroxiredoxin
MADSTVITPVTPSDPNSEPSLSPNVPAARPVPRLNPVLLVFAILPLLALIVALAIGTSHNTASDSLTPPAVIYTAPQFVGMTAPDFTIKTSDGGSVTLSKLRGQVVFLNFWATWCTYCGEEMLVFQKLITHEIPGKATVLAVDSDPLEDAATINTFEQSLGVKLPSAMDADSTVSNTYEVIGKPRTFVIDAQGIVQYDQIGPMTEDMLRKYMAKLAPNSTASIAATTAPTS